MAALGGQNRWGVTAKELLEPDSHVRARAGVSKGQDSTGYLGISFRSQTQASTCHCFPRSAPEGLCPSPRSRGEAHGCPRRNELSVGGQGVTQGARCAGTGVLGRARARLAPRSRHNRRQASASGGDKYGFVPGRLPERRVRCPPRPAAPRVPPAPHGEPSPAWHPPPWECSPWGNRGTGKGGCLGMRRAGGEPEAEGRSQGVPGMRVPAPSGAGRPRCLRHGRRPARHL